jgi:hypothetical protein
MAALFSWAGLDPDDIPNHMWHEVPLSEQQALRLERGYRVAMVEQRKYHVGSCPDGKHLWMRPERGPWTCEHCPEWRWNL